MARVTRTILEREYVFDTIRIGDARKMKREWPDPSDYNVAFIAASLRAGGNEEATPEWVDANLPFFNNAFIEFLKAAYEANGMTLKLDAQPGEEEPAPGPADEAGNLTPSTSGTSTEASAAGSATE